MPSIPDPSRSPAVDAEPVSALALTEQFAPTREAVAPDFGEMMARYLGAAIMRWLADDDVTEIYVNPQDHRVWVDTHSRGRIDAGLGIAPERLEMFLNAVASAAGATLGPGAPTLQAELPVGRPFCGARVQGFVPPVSAGPSVVVRKRPTRVYSLDDYIDSGALGPAWRAALGQAVEERQTIIVCGPTGSGKSTFANALLLEIHRRCPGDRLVILEDTVELQCPAPDHLALRTTPELSLTALVKATLRASPTRIVIGEVRDQAALDFLDATATGHPGGVCTVHASDAYGALLRLDRLAQRANVPPQAPLIADAIDLIVTLAGAAGGFPTRRVVDLARLTGLAPDGRFALSRCTEAGTWIPA